MPMPNHCVECDKPVVSGKVLKKELVLVCDKCKEKEDDTKICGGCGEVDCDGSCVISIDEEPMSDCCTAPFTYPGWPDSDFCSQCHEHSGVSEDE